MSKVLTLLPVDLSQESQRLEFEAFFTWRKSLDHPPWFLLMISPSGEGESVLYQNLWRVILFRKYSELEIPGSNVDSWRFNLRSCLLICIEEVSCVD